MKHIIIILLLLFQINTSYAYLHSSKAFIVVNTQTQQVIANKNENMVIPIASITKLMTAIITLEQNNNLSTVTITKDDIDTLKRTRSRLPIGTKLSKDQALLIMLQSSENRAASALLRNFPGGFHSGIAAMNKKAKEIGMLHTTFVDSNGLNPKNVSTPSDLVKLLEYASKNDKIRSFSTSKSTKIGRLLYINSNYLVRQGKLPILAQKTGFINEAGYCVVMKVVLNKTPYVMVFMGAKNKNGRFLDALHTKQVILSNRLASR